MAHPQLRIWGDPFRQEPDSHSARLRALIDAARRRGMEVSVSLTAAHGDAVGAGRIVPLTDGARSIEVHTGLAAPAIDAVLAAANTWIADTAPLVVFGSADDVLQAGLEYPDACRVLPAQDHDVATLLEAVFAFSATWPSADPGTTVDKNLLRPFLDLPLPRGDETVVLHLATGFAVESSWLEALRSPLEASGLTLRSVDSADGAAVLEGLASARAVLWPCEMPPPISESGPVLASGRPLIAPQFVGDLGSCLPIAGRFVEERLALDRRTCELALRRLVADWPECERVAARARRYAVEKLSGPRPVPPPAELRSTSRPLVVLEAPMFETSSSSLLTIETARALLERDCVDVLIRPSVPFQGGMAEFCDRAPELVGRFSRRPPRADLWISSGWPPRPSRSDARMHALRVDWEYGALPSNLTPHVTDSADRVIVHSEFVRRTLVDAGIAGERIVKIPHGVNGDVFCDSGPANSRVLEFKRDRQAVLFVGGLIWRKGIDAAVKTLLEGYTAADDVCFVVKPTGAGSSYHGFHLRDLVERMQSLAGAVPVMIIDEELSAEDLAGVYRACDVLLHPYRGEGFGLPVLEARACGLPVVVTAGGSTDDFCDGDACFSIPSTRRFVELDEPHEGRPFVLEPDAVRARDLLREALSPAARDVARREATNVRETYVWAGAAASIEDLAWSAYGARLSLV